MQIRLCVLVILFFALSVQAQTPFTASWNFEDTRDGSVNNNNINISSVSFAGVDDAGYPAGVSGKAFSVRLWTTGGLNTGKYLEFSIHPQSYRYAVNSISFAINRSPQGPTQAALRSSQDGFSNNIGTNGIGESFGTQNYSVSFNGLENTVTFRIYAYSAADNLGTIRIDNLRVNGTVTVVPLPVELTYFRGQVFDRKVELDWETHWEQNAAHFDVQRSKDLREFTTLQSIAATGDTRAATHYQATDDAPVPGVMYYRLRQVDRDGQFVYSKIIPIHFRVDLPEIWVFGNPASANHIQLRLRHLSPDDLHLFTLNGKSVPLRWQPSGGDDYIFQTIGPAGWYWLVGYSQGQRISRKIWLNTP